MSRKLKVQFIRDFAMLPIDREQSQHLCPTIDSKMLLLLADLQKGSHLAVWMPSNAVGEYKNRYVRVIDGNVIGGRVAEEFANTRVTISSTGDNNIRIDFKAYFIDDTPQLFSAEINIDEMSNLSLRSAGSRMVFISSIRDGHSFTDVLSRHSPEDLALPEAVGQLLHQAQGA